MHCPLPAAAARQQQRSVLHLNAGTPAGGYSPGLPFRSHASSLTSRDTACRIASPPLGSAVKEATGTSVSTYTTHRRMGIAAMTLGLFQLTALVLRQGGAHCGRAGGGGCWPLTCQLAAPAP